MTVAYKKLSIVIGNPYVSNLIPLIQSLMGAYHCYDFITHKILSQALQFLGCNLPLGPKQTCQKEKL